jgi:flagellar assembly factor FliW
MEPNHMIAETTRFGRVEIDEGRVVTFPSGLLGFTPRCDYALIEPEGSGPFLWMQSLDAPDLAFVVTRPEHWWPEYRPTLRQEQMSELGLRRPDDAEVLVIVNRYDRTLTANLQGPLVINAAARLGMQLVVAERRWTTRHELVRLPAAAAVVA